jgi:ribose-phosphate pyrophosphokinase
MPAQAPLLFAPAASRALAEKVAAELELQLAPLEEREFEDGEHKIRPLCSVRNRDVFALHGLHGEPGASANDKLIRLLFLIGALRDAGARRVTALVPYLCYARKDRRSKARDPLSLRYVASCFEVLGTDCVVVLEAHNVAAFENAFRCRTVHLESAALLARHCAAAGDGNAIVVSPDVGGVKRARRFREELEQQLEASIPFGFVDKSRSEGVVLGGASLGDYAGRCAYIVDDLISSGTTMRLAAAACRQNGARRVVAVAAHGVFGAGADANFAGGEIDAVIVTDSVASSGLTDAGARSRLTILEASPLFAEAIRRLIA